jgi:hypothetical protein
VPDTFVLLAIISGLGVCLLTLVNTDFGLIVLILAMLLSPEFRMGGIIGDRAVIIRLDDILLIIVFITWLVKLAITKGIGLWKRTAYNLPITMYIFFLLVSTILSAIQGRINFLSGAIYILKYIEYFMIFFMVTNHIKSKRQIKVFIFFILITSLITCIYGLNFARTHQRATAPFEISNVAGDQGEPNTLGGYLVLVFFITLGLALYTQSTFWVPCLMILAAIQFITLLQTLSRSSYLGFIAAFLALTILTTRKKTLLLLAIIAFILTGWSLLPQKVFDRIATTFAPQKVYTPFGIRITLDASAASRIESWKIVFPMWEMNPILGCGVTGVGIVDTQYPLVLGEGGILGLWIFIWLLSVILRKSLQTFKAIEDEYFQGLTLGYVAGFIGLLMHSFGAATFILIRIMEPFWFLTAIIIMLTEIQDTEKQAQLSPMPEHAPILGSSNP